jgi:molecular chaperone GrpE
MAATRKTQGEGGAAKPRRRPPAKKDPKPEETVNANVDPEVVAKPMEPELHADEAAAGGAAFGDTELQADLAAELELARVQANDHLDTARRVQADFENFRKRMQREQADAIARAGQRIVEELLPAVDNLERAIDHAVAGGEVSSDLLKGVEMVHSQIIDVFRKEGVEVDDPFGRLFDPAKEQAVGQREEPDVPEGTVVDVYQKGYTLAGKVIRPAMVVVSTK